MADSQKYGRTANLFDYQTMEGTIKGYYLDSNGNIQESAFAAITDYIPCSGGKFCLAKVGGVSTSICLYDNNKHFLYGQAYNTSSGSDKQTIVVNSSVNASYIRFTYFYTAAPQDDLSAIMLNAGSTALPYQPYLDWQHSLRKLTTATEAVENPLYSDGTAITSYTLKGNTVQNGTPTSSNPVDVNGVGERTENLFDYETMKDGKTGYYLDASGNEIENIGYWSITKYIPVDDTVFTLTRTFRGNAPAICLYDSNKNFITGVSYQGEQVVTISSNTNAAYIRFSYFIGEPLEDIAHDMLNVGSTALPYEPYGYKIPISNGEQTTNIYLGSTQTVRQVKKLVLDGTEAWETRASYTYCDRFVLQKSGFTFAGQSGYCSHFDVLSVLVNTYPVMTYNNGEQIVVNYSAKGTTTLAQFKNWLAEQFNNGTPVTVWYVLATPETAAVNEPLMKIGTYADTLSNATAIPTTEGANSITVDTAVQPSEFTATWTGWHDASVKEKSENLFDKSTAMQGKQYNENGALVDVESNWYATDYIPVTGGETYIRSINSTGVGSIFNEYNNQKQFIGRYTPTFGTPFTVSEDAAYITFSINTTNTPLDIYMLNTGSTALPYEPYWK